MINTESYFNQDIEELTIAKDLGICFVIDGRTCSYHNDINFISSVLADSAYMRYYDPNDQGTIIQIHLDKVNRYK